MGGDTWAILCSNLNLEWSQKFKSLGNTYDIDNFNNVADLIIELKIKEIYRN